MHFVLPYDYSTPNASTISNYKYARGHISERVLIGTSTPRQFKLDEHFSNVNMSRSWNKDE